MSGRINVSVKDGHVQMMISEQGAPPATLSMTPLMASRVGAALLGASPQVKRAGSLFTSEPMMTIANPSFEVMRSDAGQIFVALQAGKLRPIVLQLGEAAAQELINAVSVFRDKEGAITDDGARTRV
jgi:hypothetical protein